MADQINTLTELSLQFSLAESEGAEVAEKLSDECSEAYNALCGTALGGGLQSTEAAYFYIPARCGH